MPKLRLLKGRKRTRTKDGARRARQRVQEARERARDVRPDPVLPRLPPPKPPQMTLHPYRDGVLLANLKGNGEHARTVFLRYPVTMTLYYSPTDGVVFAATRPLRRFGHLDTLVWNTTLAPEVKSYA